MDEKFNNCEIILGRLPHSKAVPILIIEIDDKIFGLQLYSYKSHKRKNSNEVIIGRPKNLKYDCAVNISKKVPLKSISMITKISFLSTKQYKKIMDAYAGRTNYKDLKKAKREQLALELELSILNNEKYDLKDKKIINSRRRKGSSRSLDYIEPVHTPYIKVYRF